MNLSSWILDAVLDTLLPTPEPVPPAEAAVTG